MPTLTYELPGALQEISFAIGKPLSAMKAASELLEKERKRGVKEGIARALLLVLLGCALALLFGWLLCSWAWGKVVLAVLICGSQELLILLHFQWIIESLTLKLLGDWQTSFQQILFYCVGYVLFLPSTNKCLIDLICAFSLLVCNSRQPQRSTVSLFFATAMIVGWPFQLQLDIQLQVSASDSASPDGEKLAQEAKQQFSSLGDKTGEALATWTTIVTQ